MKRKYSDEALLYALLDRYGELGRVPTAREMLKPSHHTYQRRFGSWNDALKAAYLPIKQLSAVVSVVKELSMKERMYLACAIDTDGHIQVDKGIAYVANNHKGFLENIRRMCNGAGHLAVDTTGNKTYYRLVFRKAEAFDVLSQVVDYLIIKKGKALEIMLK